MQLIVPQLKILVLSDIYHCIAGIVRMRLLIGFVAG